MQNHPKLIILQDCAVCQHWLTPVLWQGALAGRQSSGFPWQAVPRGLTSLGLDVREGSATGKLLILCLFCPSHDNLKRALVPAKPHIFWSAHGVQKRLMGISGFCMHSSTQLLFSLCQDPTSQQAAVLPFSQEPWRWVFCCPRSPIVSYVHTTWALASKAFVLPTTNF